VGGVVARVDDGSSDVPVRGSGEPDACGRAVVDPLALILEELTAVLGEPALDPATELLELRTFDSLAIVAVLERVEDRLGVEVDPRLVVPETFATPSSLAAVVARVLAVAP
jgi:acyl carrier protein